MAVSQTRYCLSGALLLGIGVAPRVGITTAFAVGISQDLIEGAPLGLSSPGSCWQHCCCYSVINVFVSSTSPAKSGRSGFAVVERGNRTVAAKRRQRAGDAT